MSAITLEAIQAKQTELVKLIQQFQAQPVDHGREIEIEGNTISLAPGEHYAGTVLDADGNHMHDLVLMAARPGKRITWQDALDWAEEVGGALPTRQEQALLFANCKPHLDGVSHWSCEEHEENASYAWYCHFLDGGQGTARKDDELAAVAVRLIEERDATYAQGVRDGLEKAAVVCESYWDGSNSHTYGLTTAANAIRTLKER